MALPKFISCSTNGGIYRGCVHNATLESGNCEAIANKCREGAIARCFLLQHKCRICIGSSTGFEYSRVSCPEALDTCDGADREISNGRGSSFQTGYPLCGHCCLRYLSLYSHLFAYSYLCMSPNHATCYLQLVLITKIIHRFAISSHGLLRKLDLHLLDLHDTWNRAFCEFRKLCMSQRMRSRIYNTYSFLLHMNLLCSWLVCIRLCHGWAWRFELWLEGVFCCINQLCFAKHLLTPRREIWQWERWSFILSYQLSHSSKLVCCILFKSQILQKHFVHWRYLNAWDT